MINRALRLLRVYHNLKQKDLADRLGISNSHLCEIEKGLKPVAYDLLQKYSVVFEIPVSSIALFAEKAGGNVKTKIASKALRLLEWLDTISQYDGNDDTEAKHPTTIR